MPENAYKNASFQPKIPPIITKATSLTSGEVIKKENATPIGIFASKKPINKGIEEQEQKGVTAPNNAAAILPSPHRNLPTFSLNLLGSKKVLIKLIIVTTINIKINILITS